MLRKIAPTPPHQQQQAVRKPEKGLGKATNGTLLLSVDTIASRGMDIPVSQHHEEFDSSGGICDSGEDVREQQKTEQLAKQLTRSAFVDDVDVDRKSLSIVKIADENRIDYTNLVKRKYFEQEKNGKERHTTLLHVSAKEGCHFDEGIPSEISDDLASDQSSLSSGVGVERRSNNNEIINNKLLGGDDRTLTSRPNTPPLTLYSERGAPPLTLSSSGPNTPNNNNPDTAEMSAGHLSPGPGMDMYSVENTPNSQALATPAHASFDDTPLAGSPASAASSRGSMSTATLSLKQPVLYSAIGSLEHVNYNSLTNLNKRFLAPSKEFCKPKGLVHSILIPPARLQHQQHRKKSSSSLLPSITSSGDLQIEQQKDRGGTSSRASNIYNGTNSSARKTSTTTSTNKNATNKTKKNLEKKKKNPENINSSIPTSMRSNRRHTTAAVSSNDKNATNAKSIHKNNSGNQNNNSRKKSSKKVSLDPAAKTKKKSKTIEMFRPSSDAYTPRIERKNIKYKTAEARPSVQDMSSPMGTLQRPNFRDALRRVAMIIQQHIVKIESRFEQQGVKFSNRATQTKVATDDGLFHASMRDTFNEDCYRTPTYRCNMARIPMARPGMVYGLRKIKVMYEIPSETEIYDFGHQLFKSVQLSSECSIVCLIYIERLMEIAKVPLLACTWRPIFMCGLLLASKVWQDLSSWNIEFSSVYPQFSLEAINKLELNFLRIVKWDLYISSSSYAKYYFALRSLVEKQDFRQRYNRMVGGVGNVAHAEALKVQERTERVKEKALLQLSRSM